MYCMGENAEEILATMNITAEQKKEYQQVVQKFDKYFKVSSVWTTSLQMSQMNNLLQDSIN